MSRYLKLTAAFLVATQGASAACTNPSVRKAWTSLTEGEKADFIGSTLCLMDPAQAPAQNGYAGSKSRWDELQAAHVAQVQFIHKVGAFFPWHRWFLSIHEDLLRSECGYKGPYPYWDEQNDFELGPIEQASIFSADPITGFGSGIVDANNCTIDGAFANKLFDLTITLERVPPGQCLMRRLDQEQYRLTSQPFVDNCLAKEDFVSFADCLGGDLQPHGGGHVAVGGTMGNPSLSPADPLFFMHHANLDRLWWEWQLKNSSRLTAMGGPNVAYGGDSEAYQPASLPVSAFLPYFGDHGNETTLNHSLWTAGLRENVTIAEVIDSHSDRICADYEELVGTGDAQDTVKKLSSVLMFLKKISI
ncbi:hypothetical protein F5X68DRAFT_240442 [Plectosphaerella plurivora]|uniref:Tyrosinase copper-binding domain-containing protein n=1 Tax=Plectosphaerella plurivora TaxID=936078 RepID=A0A9P8VB48_9PEZI|nr:hypothetical protein F5X68DRAFT_240442 [Plectosphaerella plurivora]